MAPILASAVGIAYLSALNKSQLGRVLNRAYRAGIFLAAKVTLDEIQQGIQATKKRDCSLGYGRVMPDTGAIGLSSPDKTALNTEIVGVSGQKRKSFH
ncbi:MAG: hypothetical protein OSB02_11370 [Rhodospirillaceae bacterium]|nr:hypothetical protein [Rhodospirillaceae bacterium]